MSQLANDVGHLRHYPNVNGVGGGMAGKRQHYVPQLLQRGFLAQPSEEAERTWLHRRGAKARLVGIRDVGVEDWFYSRKATDGQSTLDDAITDYEGDLSKSVRVLREAPFGSPVDAHHAAETVVHLVTRTAHLRGVMSAGMTSIVREVEALFSDPARLGGMMGLTGPALAGAVTDAIRSTAADLVPVGIPSAFSERLLTAIMRELGDQFVAQAVAMLGPLFPNLFGGLADKVRDAHNGIVAKPLEDHGWVKALAGFDWTIEAAVDLILPDCVALARERDGVLAPLLFTTAAEAEIVVLPVASDRMLVGRRGSAAIDLSRFNEEAAAASENFFIAARFFDAEDLSTRIGTGVAEELSATIAEAVREAEQTRSLSDADIPAAFPQMLVERNFSFKVTLADCGDAVLAKELGDVIKAVVAALAGDLPLQGLDGITIAADYDAALANLDRGDANLPPVTSGALGYGLGVAKPVSVMRDGRRKEHLVVAAGLAETWIAPEDGARAEGLHILIKMLAGIAHTTRYADAFATSFSPDPMARELHLAAATTPSGYWSARQAAFVAPDYGEIYADLVLESLAYAERKLTMERERMADQSDIGGAFVHGLECASAVLCHAADWLGHRDGLAEGQSFAGSDLPDRLKARGLDRWIELFGRDLAGCYGPEGTLEFSVLTTLSRHVERLFWSFGLYCWPEKEDVRCIVSDQPFLPPQLS
jgi:hypothetical protein